MTSTATRRRASPRLSVLALTALTVLYALITSGCVSFSVVGVERRDTGHDELELVGPSASAEPCAFTGSHVVTMRMSMPTHGTIDERCSSHPH